ncbi:MAG TPA: haloacid dehalogenase type II [Candidatus Polarisedimenticolia bacterium]|nr:haloacid dehalogenase type II [Candidatus Polarisedimenticolia bacterium]
MLDVARFEALTFDCYGTLIDWETGLLAALHGVLGAHRVPCDDERLLRLFAAAEGAIEAGPYRPYREVLGGAMDRIAGVLGLVLAGGERDALARSLPDWPAFADTVPALQALRRRTRLGIVSNIDDDLFAATARRLEVPFDAVVTAQQVGSYKPAPAHFHRVLERLALPKEKVLHVAQSRYHDIAPARALGWSTVWVNRRGGREGSGATPEKEATPDLEVTDLATLLTRAGLV